MGGKERERRSMRMLTLARAWESRFRSRRAFGTSSWKAGLGAGNAHAQSHTKVGRNVPRSRFCNVLG